MVDDATTLTISIVNTDNRALLARCLASIEASVRRTPYRIVVVDNASTDGSAEMVAADFPDVTLVRNPERLGYGASHNRAIAVATSPYLLLLNEDMEMVDDAIDRMMDKAQRTDRLGVLGCRILNPDRTLQHSCFRFPSLRRELFDALFPYTLLFGRAPLRSKMFEWDHHSEREVDIVLGCCLLVRRDVLEGIGPFDPAFFVYSEEHDLCRRARDAGLRVLFTAEAEMIHFGGQTSKRMSLRMALVQLDSRMRYFRKHHGLAAAAVFRLILCVAMLIRLGGWIGLWLLRQGRDKTASARLAEYWASTKFVFTGQR